MWSICLQWIRAALVAGVLLFSFGGFAGDNEYEDIDPQAEKEQVSAPLFVTIAYSVIWLSAVGYLVFLRRRAADVDQEIAQLKTELGMRDNV